MKISTVTGNPMTEKEREYLLRLIKRRGFLLQKAGVESAYAKVHYLFCTHFGIMEYAALPAHLIPQATRFLGSLSKLKDGQTVRSIKAKPRKHKDRTALTKLLKAGSNSNILNELQRSYHE